MTFLIGCILVLWVCAIGLIAFGTLISLQHFKSTSRTAKLEFPPITILKPLKGFEPGIEENLKSFFHIDYSQYEIIFSVANDKDAICSIVEKLINTYPTIPAKLLKGDVCIGPNPKVNNLFYSYQAAQYDWILISDSNVRVDSTYLHNLVSQIDQSTGIVTSVIAGQDSDNFSGSLEAAYLNTFYARGMLLANAFGHPCVVGKCMFFKKSIASRFGGIQILSQFLAEDYMAGEAIRHLGLKIKIMNSPTIQVIGKNTLKNFWSRHIRWGRIRKTQAPLTFLFEPLSYSFVSGLLGYFALNVIFNINLSLFVVLHGGFWFLCDFLLMRKLNPHIQLLYPLYWVCRELLALPLWIHIGIGKTVHWRGNRLTLQAGGILK